MEIGVYAMELDDDHAGVFERVPGGAIPQMEVLVDKLALTSEALIPHSIMVDTAVAFAG
jgi:hypothetical protein